MTAPEITALAIVWLLVAAALAVRLGAFLARPGAIPNGRCPRCERLFEYCRCTPHGPRGGGR
ncbi:hypothetical protein ACLIYP_05430 [Streptomyces nanhaiensis]|uniref:hypothetical protein n=1 Tax=Streptomyces nanhaiensis TaxID=679319 RepID=UPI00399D06A8